MKATHHLLVDDFGLEFVCDGGPSRKSIFGDAKPVDTTKREREIDEKLMRSQINDGAKRRSIFYSNLMETPFVADKNEERSSKRESRNKKNTHGHNKYKTSITKPKNLQDHIYKKMCFLYALWNLADNNDCYQLYEQFLHHSTDLMKLSIKETGNVSYICKLGGSSAAFREIQE